MKFTFTNKTSISKMVEDMTVTYMAQMRNQLKKLSLEIDWEKTESIELDIVVTVDRAGKYRDTEEVNPDLIK